MQPRSAGRPRDEGIDQAVHRATLRLLAEQGYEALSVTAIADAAGTTRQAVYRRWPSKAEVAVAAIAALPEAAELVPTGAHREDLVAELGAFTRGVLRPGGIAMVGTMLRDSTDPALRRAYRRHIVGPRRRRIRAILQAALDDGTLAPTTHLDTLVASCTGSLYALALAGEAIPADYPERLADQVFGPQTR